MSRTAQPAAKLHSRPYETRHNIQQRLQQNCAAGDTTHGTTFNNACSKTAQQAIRHMAQHSTWPAAKLRSRRYDTWHNIQHGLQQNCTAGDSTHGTTFTTSVEAK
jgi:hypothetical protein